MMMTRTRCTSRYPNLVWSPHMPISRRKKCWEWEYKAFFARGHTSCHNTCQPTEYNCMEDIQQQSPLEMFECCNAFRATKKQTIKRLQKSNKERAETRYKQTQLVQHTTQCNNFHWLASMLFFRCTSCYYDCIGRLSKCSKYSYYSTFLYQSISLGVMKH